MMAIKSDMQDMRDSKQEIEDISTDAAGQNGHGSPADTTFKDEPGYTPRKIRIVTIGAGYSGLTLAHKFQHQHVDLQEFVEHTIYEARSELGGTWLVNTYPGVVCDVPSHIYVRGSLWNAK